MGENNTVTISVEEYRKLLEIQARADILKEYTIPQTYSVSRGMIARILGFELSNVEEDEDV
ncbi:hypothetical protein [Dorea longicatena]|uniref:hypothetical protein n=1 Tax=Dorea longicatena TaxID=88431 RepID=UPI001EDED14C|nr:hypothetical protein [Dorea longicatena]MCB5913457.1 hypothetical protein [Lachnospiraceae bacterium 210521-DFI.5.19]MCG4796686.1 hypothetical protein [Dorea longicatena]